MTAYSYAPCTKAFTKACPFSRVCHVGKRQSGRRKLRFELPDEIPRCLRRDERPDSRGSACCSQSCRSCSRSRIPWRSLSACGAGGLRQRQAVREVWRPYRCRWSSFPSCFWVLLGYSLPQRCLRVGRGRNNVRSGPRPARIKSRKERSLITSIEGSARVSESGAHPSTSWTVPPASPDGSTSRARGRIHCARGNRSGSAIGTGSFSGVEISTMSINHV